MDKLLHLGCGFCISLIVGLLCYFGFNLSQPEAYGFVAAIIAGAVKETFDAIRAKEWTVRTWDVFDFLATWFGGLIALAVAQAVAANTKVNSFATDITDNTTNIAITKNGGGSFTAQGTIRAIVYAEIFDAMASL